jgi:prepilin-type N-terminal cleavage/methylation domain-containing protein
MSARRGDAGGFTLLELMISISMIAILASIALPKFADMILTTQQGSAKGNLGTMRSALDIYYADNQGSFPTCVTGPGSVGLTNSLVPKYIAAIPAVNNGLHPSTTSVYCDQMMLPGNVHDGQGWYYDGAFTAGGQPDSFAGSLWVACDHTDTAGSNWTSF